MKLQVTKNNYKRANCNLYISDNLKELSAYGYTWFKYLTIDNVGNVILSEYTSQSSKAHIYDIESILDLHSIKIDLTLNFCNGYSDTFKRSISAIHNLGHDGQNLNNPKNAISNEIKLIKYHIKELIKAIKRPRSHKKKNENRKNEIKKCLYKIKDLRNFKNNFLNKKKFKTKKKFNNYHFLSYSNGSKELLKNKIFKDIYGKYLKLNDDRNINFYFNNFRIKQAHLYQHTSDGIPLNIDNLCKVFSLNQNYDFSKIIFYTHIESIENSIPSDIDSKEYHDFLKMIKRLNITKDNLNTLQLDKIHTAIINKNERLERGPIEKREWPAYQVSEYLLTLENLLNEDKKQVISVIKNQGDLKKESRKMKHCIGQNNMGYHEKIIKKGYQALNFKGYTFFLNPDLTINETHGKNNMSTPDNIKNELIEILEA